MIKFNDNYYTEIVPLGEECYTCQSIDVKFNKDIRNSGYPYDYVGHSYINQITNNIKEIKLINSDDIKYWYSGQEYFYLYEKYDFKYWHDTKYKNKEEFSVEDTTNFIDKYNRRYNRLMDVLNNNNKVIFYSVCHFDDIYIQKYKKEDLINLYNTLKQCNKNIILIAINYDGETFIHEDLYHYNINIDKTENFHETKQKFTESLYSFVNTNFIIE